MEVFCQHHAIRFSQPLLRPRRLILSQRRSILRSHEIFFNLSTFENNAYFRKQSILKIDHLCCQFWTMTFLAFKKKKDVFFENIQLAKNTRGEISEIASAEQCCFREHEKYQPWSALFHRKSGISYSEERLSYTFLDMLHREKFQTTSLNAKS